MKALEFNDLSTAMISASNAPGKKRPKSKRLAARELRPQVVIAFERLNDVKGYSIDEALAVLSRAKFSSKS